MPQGPPSTSDQGVQGEEEEFSDPDNPPEVRLSSSPDDTIMSPPPTTGDDFKQFQDLYKRVATGRSPGIATQTS